MPRFVVLTHDWPALHWDFMLEKEASLRTWRLPAPPAVGQDCAALPLPDHRLAYLDYEGPVSGNRGSVTRWDAGTFVVLSESPGRIELVLTGEKIHGRVVLEAASPDAPEDASWRFRVEPQGQ